MSALTRKQSYGASLDTLPVNPKLKALPTVAFKGGSSFEPLDKANGIRQKSSANNTYWKFFFKGIIKIAYLDTHAAAASLKKAAHNLLVQPHYLAVTNLAIQKMNKQLSS